MVGLRPGAWSPHGRAFLACFCAVAVVYLVLGGGMRDALARMAWEPKILKAPVEVVDDGAPYQFAFPPAPEESAAAKCGGAELNRERRADSVGNTCPSGEEAKPGCARCNARLPHSFEMADPFWLSEFQLDVRTGTRNFVPIFEELERAVAKVAAPKRLVLDVGFTDFNDMAWMADVYGKSATQIHLYEPNPVTMKRIQGHVADGGSYAAALPDGVSFKAFEQGVGNTNRLDLFWLNKDGSRSSFQRVRSDNYEQVPHVRNVSQLDVLYPNLKDTLIPFMKISAGRWEHPALLGGTRLLRDNAAVVMADITPLPNNSHVVQTLADAGFQVYALGCGTLARIHQDRPWWWSPVVAVKPFLAPIAEEFVCWDFTRTELVCDEPHAAAFPPHGCRNASDPVPNAPALLPRDSTMEIMARRYFPVESTTHASPSTHVVLKYLFLSIVFSTLGLFGVFIVFPLLMALAAQVGLGRTS